MENIEDIPNYAKKARKLNNKFFNKNNITLTDKFTVAIKGNNELIGLEDIVNTKDEENKPTYYKCRAKCISEKALIYCMNKEDFMKLKISQQSWWGLMVNDIKERVKEQHKVEKHTKNAIN